MKKIIITHIKGSKTNQTETFTLPTDEILFGRDSDCQVIFDPEKDDLVSRKHLKILQQEYDRFLLTDLNSTNGTFVNKKKISEPVYLNFGDEIELGKDGSKFVFDVDPRPQVATKATRLGESISVVKSTREQRIEPQISVSRLDAISATESGIESSSPDIGRNTVERMITQVKGDTRRKVINVGAGILGVIILVAGFFFYQNYSEKLESQNQLVLAKEEMEKAINASNEKFAEFQQTAPKTSSDIFREYGDSTVLIENSWKLIFIPTGEQLYQVVSCDPEERIKCSKKTKLPWYTYINNSVEPYLVSGEKPGYRAVGSSGTGLAGSGFVVSDNGFILTNRHVAANWETQSMNFQFPGYLIHCTDKCRSQLITRSHPNYLIYKKSLSQFIPGKPKSLGGKPVSGKMVEGRNDFLEVTFPKTRLRIPARLVRVSDRADTALIKIDLPQKVNPVQLAVEESVSAGDSITIMGYPGISPNVMVKINSQDPLNRDDDWRTIPEPTVTGGNIGKVIIGEAAQLSDSIGGYYSEMGDVYQLTSNSTGSGNSGGPVFNDKAQVIGIFTYGKQDRSGINITFAVPIKYGKEIMGIQQVIN